MKALVKAQRAPGIWMEEIPEPKVGPNDVLIKVRKTAICGTDMHIYLWDQWAQKTIPVPDLVAVNLYPFEETVARKDCRLEDAIENIDMGGPTLLRAAAKNHGAVTVIVDAADYGPVLGEMQQPGGVSDATRFRLATKAFAHTAAYDGAISEYLTSPATPTASPDRFPGTLALVYRKVQDLRYGENPHQGGAVYRAAREPEEPTVSFARVLQGKELSYNNLLDLEAALACAKEFDEVACVIIKHNTPCGVAAAGASPSWGRAAHPSWLPFMVSHSLKVGSAPGQNASDPQQRHLRAPPAVHRAAARFPPQQAASERSINPQVRQRRPQP